MHYTALNQIIIADQIENNVDIPPAEPQTLYTSKIDFLKTTGFQSSNPDTLGFIQHISDRLKDVFGYEKVGKSLPEIVECMPSFQSYYGKDGTNHTRVLTSFISERDSYVLLYPDMQFNGALDELHANWVVVTRPEVLALLRKKNEDVLDELFKFFSENYKPDLNETKQVHYDNPIFHSHDALPKIERLSVEQIIVQKMVQAFKETQNVVDLDDGALKKRFAPAYNLSIAAQDILDYGKSTRQIKAIGTKLIKDKNAEKTVELPLYFPVNKHGNIRHGHVVHRQRLAIDALNKFLEKHHNGTDATIHHLYTSHPSVEDQYLKMVSAEIKNIELYKKSKEFQTFADITMALIEELNQKDQKLAPIKTEQRIESLKAEIVKTNLRPHSLFRISPDSIFKRENPEAFESEWEDDSHIRDTEILKHCATAVIETIKRDPQLIAHPVDAQRLPDDYVMVSLDLLYWVEWRQNLSETPDKSQLLLIEAIKAQRKKDGKAGNYEELFKLSYPKEYEALKKEIENWKELQALKKQPSASPEGTIIRFINAIIWFFRELFGSGKNLQSSNLVNKQNASNGHSNNKPNSKGNGKKQLPAGHYVVYYSGLLPERTALNPEELPRQNQYDCSTREKAEAVVKSLLGKIRTSKNNEEKSLWRFNLSELLRKSQYVKSFNDEIKKALGKN